MNDRGFGGGGRPPDPSRTYASMTKEYSGSSGRLKDYVNFVNKQKKEHSMIEIKFQRDRFDGDVNRKNLDLDTVSEYILGELKIKPEHILEVDLNTGRHDTKQITFKPGVDIDKYVLDFPDTFAGFHINISKMSNKEKKVTFKNVPSYIHDDELLNLCSIYGTVEGEVRRETVTLKSTDSTVTLPSSTRYVMMRMKPGMSFNNYYWMEGPLQGDQGRRITVLHSGQSQQCSYCLETIDEGCPGKGNGKKCEANGGVRAKMSVYMENLRMRTGYRSLKDEYNEMMRRFNKHCEDKDGVTDPDDIDKFVEEYDEEEDDDGDEKTNDSKVKMAPIERKNLKITELTNTVKELEKDNALKVKETSEKGEKVKNNKDKLEQHLSRMIFDGKISDEIANMVT